MIAYLPTIYPDELVYSWFCRYYIHSGCFTHKMALQELYCNRSDNPSKEFIGNLNPEARAEIAKMYPMDMLTLKHTLFPQYARFIPLEQRKKALYHIGHDSCDIHHLFCVLPRTDDEQFLRYCPLCAVEDRKQEQIISLFYSIIILLSDSNNLIHVGTISRPHGYKNVHMGVCGQNDT